MLAEGSENKVNTTLRTFQTTAKFKIGSFLLFEITHFLPSLNFLITNVLSSNCNNNGTIKQYLCFNPAMVSLLFRYTYGMAVAPGATSPKKSYSR